MIGNRVRGLYRFCWVITIVLSTFAIFSFYDKTTEPSGYEPKMVDSPPANWREMRAMSLPEVGVLLIPKWVPPDPEMELKMAEQCREISEGGQATFVAGEVRSVSWLKMLVLVLGATCASALATRGTVGALVWIARVLSPNYS